MKDIENSPKDTLLNTVKKAVVDAFAKISDMRLFYAENSEGAEGNVSSVGHTIMRHAKQGKDSALSYLSMRRADLFLLMGTLSPFKAFTVKDFENLAVSVKTAFATASIAPLSAYSLTSSFAAQAVTAEAQKAITLEFNQIRQRVKVAQDPTFMGPMPTEQLEQLRHSPKNLDALKSAFKEAGFIYTGNNQAVCTPEKFEELVNQFGSVASNELSNTNQPTVLVATFSNEAQLCGRAPLHIQNAPPVEQIIIPDSMKNDKVA